MPHDMNSIQRHSYFVKMLSGIEIDDFAREVARMSLMLVDYPAPDGWRLHGAEALEIRTPRAVNYTLTRIVLCNPPFEDCDSNERQTHKNLFSVINPASVLHRVLERSTDLIGFLLPRSFLMGRGYKAVRSHIGRDLLVNRCHRPPRQGRTDHSDAESVRPRWHPRGAVEWVGSEQAMVEKGDLRSLLL